MIKSDCAACTLPYICDLLFLILRPEFLHHTFKAPSSADIHATFLPFVPFWRQLTTAQTFTSSHMHTFFALSSLDLVAPGLTKHLL